MKRIRGGRGWGELGPNDSLEQHRIDASAETNSSADLDDGYPIGVKSAELRIGVDVDETRREAVSSEQLRGLVA